MSGAVRNYSGTVSLGPHQRKVGGRRMRGCGCLAFLVLLGAIGAYGYWTTRDTCPVERVIPAQMGYQVVADDVLAKRAKLAGSRLWQALPPSVGLSEVPERLTQDFGVPEYVLNNVVPGSCHLCGNDVRAFSDVLVVTRMTRVGSLLEKGHRFLPAIQRDRAGGLNLRHVPDAGLYYAVRGRIFVASPSREALVRALTLESHDAITPEALPRPAAGAGTQDLCGTVALGTDDPLGGVFEAVGFALRVDTMSATLKCRAALRADYRDRLAGLLDGLAPQQLVAPPEGMLEISMDLRKPIRELWRTIGEIAGFSEQMEGLWDAWSAETDAAYGEIPPAVTALLGPLGPGVRLTWSGMDLLEMIPMPEVVATFDAQPEALIDAFAALPRAPEEAMPWDTFLRYDAEKGRVHLPMIGGPSIEPTAGVYGEALLVSSSRTIGDALLDEGPRGEMLPEPGNISVHVRPRPCLRTVVEVATMLAELRMLKGYTPNKVHAEAEPWLSAAGVVDEIQALAGYENGGIGLDLRVVCTQGGP